MSKYFDSKNLTFMEPRVVENGNHMIMTNVHSETKTKYLNIDTRFQEEYNMNDNADYTVSIPQAIRDVQSIQLTNVEIPASFHPFSVYMKNTYFHLTKITSTSITKIVTIADGYYTEETLVDALNENNDTNGCVLQTVGRNTATNEIWFGDDDSRNIGRIRYEHSDDGLEFWTNSSERMRIDSSGKIGIGTSSPSATLHVDASGGASVQISRTGSGALYLESDGTNGNIRRI